MHSRMLINESQEQMPDFIQTEEQAVSLQAQTKAMEVEKQTYLQWEGRGWR